MFVQHILDLLRAGGTDAALHFYVREYPQVTGRSYVEWELANAVWRDRVVAPACHFPAEMSRRPSGAALALVVSQLSGSPIQIPDALAGCPPLHPRHRRLLASAWRHRPENCLFPADGKTRAFFALWLAQCHAAIGDCLLAAVLLNDPELTIELRSRWLRQGLAFKWSALCVRDAAKLEALHEAALTALWVVLPFAQNDPESLADLAEAAWTLKDVQTDAPWKPLVYKAIVMLAGRLLVHAQGADRADQLARRCCAWAELGMHDRVIQEYRSDWYKSSRPPFPYPEPVLEVFQMRRLRDLERDLLASSPVGDHDSEWMRLSRSCAAANRIDRSHLEAWKRLHLAHRYDSRILVAYSNAILASPVGLMLEWVQESDETSVVNTWRELSNLEQYRHFAGKWLVLLTRDFHDQIVEFERCLADAPLLDEVESEAARAYVSALRRNRDWPSLRKLIEGNEPDVFAACTFFERIISRTLAQLDALPAAGQQVERWFRLWERLLSIPLATAELVEILETFTLLRQEATRRGNPLTRHFRFPDLERQLHRRAKAEAEILYGASLPEYEQKLRRAGIEGTIGLLNDLLAEHRGSVPRERMHT